MKEIKVEHSGKFLSLPHGMKAIYRTPELRVYGSVGQLTGGGSGIKADSASMMK